MTSRGQCPRGGVLVNVQEWGCFSNFLRADDVTRTMYKGGVLVKNPVSAPGPPPLSKILDPRLVGYRHAGPWDRAQNTYRAEVGQRPALPHSLPPPPPPPPDARNFDSVCPSRLCYGQEWTVMLCILYLPNIESFCFVFVLLLLRYY